MTTNRPLRVFLCHSSNDKPAVRELYQKLRAEPWIQPWLDEEELYPGQDWNMEIEKAVEAADAIIVCLTKNSINKEGYIQRELRVVLDVADYKPEGTLYIIPVRLEECEPPRRLRAWQYADYFEGQRERAFQRLLHSLKRRADSLELEYAEKLIMEKKGEEKAKREAKEEADRLAAQKAEEERAAQAKIESQLKAKEEADRLAAQKAEEEHVAQAKIESERKAKKEDSEVKATNHSREVVTPKIITSTSNKITLSNGMEFMRVPAGKFLMGSIYDNSDDKPQSLVDIPYDYWMARYPVTNAFYNAYAKSKGIKHPVDGWEKKKHHPATLISWTDATAYCQWLNSLLEAELASSLVSRLPTEAEWEKAARGTDGREYPWGNKFDKAKCNVAPNFFSMIGGLFVDSITPVNQFSPQGDSPYGCADMIGNVSEYTNSLFNENPYTTSSQPGSLTNHIVARGGSYLRGARCTLREKADINSVMIGFRVCIAPPLPK